MVRLADYRLGKVIRHFSIGLWGVCVYPAGSLLVLKKKALLSEDGGEASGSWKN